MQKSKITGNSKDMPFEYKDDILKRMLEFAAEIGLEIDDPVTDGNIGRCPVTGRPGKKDGAYRIHLDYPPYIWCQNHVTGESNTWTAKEERSLTDAERERFRQRIEQDKKMREAEQAKTREQAAMTARAIYEKADSAGTAEHSYAKAKALRFPAEVRRGHWTQRSWKDALLIPIYNEVGDIQSLQAIAGDGSKDLLKGGQKRGCFFPLGKIRDADRVLIGEGLATVAAGCRAVGCPGVMAVDAGNLLPVAQAVRRLAGPAAEIIFLADDDQRVGEHT